MSKRCFLILAVFLMAYSMVESSNSGSSEELSSAEKKLNKTCTKNSNCDNNKYGLECVNGKCACPDGSTMGTDTFTLKTRPGKTYTKTDTLCLLTFDAACKLVGRDIIYDRCTPSLGLACDSTTLKCACKTGAWDGSKCV